MTVLVATVEGLHDGQTLEELGVTLGRERLAAVLGVNHLAHDLLFFVKVHVVDQLQNRVGTHATLEVLAVAEVHFAVEHFVFDDLTAVETLEGVEGLLGQLALFGVAAADGVEFLLTVALQGAKFRLLGAFGFELGGTSLNVLELVVESRGLTVSDLEQFFA